MLDSLFTQHSVSSTQHSHSVFMVLHLGPSAAGSIALQRGLDESHGSRAVDCRREILFHADTLAAGDDRIGEIPVQIAERFVVALGVAGRKAAGALCRITQIRFATAPRPPGRAPVPENPRFRLQWFSL